ncbi:DUF1289 domain-containing protein [Kordiimonas sp. SCSIO 12603]|uniref:DUF1289 domain-containing protein n=1 Tax=Kordiimonas sp. SCSIO 12603 TaxID=2829596 RepID=UPI0021046958|nr:DUF1289 domain-containing protein [Kordiimonas sp. SCSIO 12603]UTW59901.1 DUF1289 domain-containing protein [Kordiimonas sp. SCSIO 12603]
MNTTVEEIKSPCMGVCQLDRAREFCMGCFRTRDDIGRWSRASNAEKQEIIDSATERSERILAEIRARKAAKQA